MSKPKNAVKQATPPAEKLIESIARSVNLLVKLKVMEAQGDRNLKEMILILHSLGCRPIEIAEALGKTLNDVSPVISRSRSSGRRKSAKRGKA